MRPAVDRGDARVRQSTALCTWIDGADQPPNLRRMTARLRRLGGIWQPDPRIAGRRRRPSIRRAACPERSRGAPTRDEGILAARTTPSPRLARRGVSKGAPHPARPRHHRDDPRRSPAARVDHGAAGEAVSGGVGGPEGRAPGRAREAPARRRTRIALRNPLAMMHIHPFVLYMRPPELTMARPVKPSVYAIYVRKDRQ